MALCQAPITQRQLQREDILTVWGQLPEHVGCLAVFVAWLAKEELEGREQQQEKTLHPVTFDSSQASLHVVKYRNTQGWPQAVPVPFQIRQAVDR